MAAAIASLRRLGWLFAQAVKGFLGLTPKGHDVADDASSEDELRDGAKMEDNLGRQTPYAPPRHVIDFVLVCWALAVRHEAHGQVAHGQAPESQATPAVGSQPQAMAPLCNHIVSVGFHIASSFPSARIMSSMRVMACTLQPLQCMRNKISHGHHRHLCVLLF